MDNPDLEARWIADDLVDATVDAAAEKLKGLKLNALSLDSRSIKTGDWFLPLRGELHDGHRFIAQVLEAGASGFFYEQQSLQQAAKQDARLADPNLTARGVAVRDTLLLYQHLAAGYRLSLKRLKLAAITGSQGKTSTKDMLGCLLGDRPAFVSRGNTNNEIGVPGNLLAIGAMHETAILEFGARKPGDLKFLCETFRPDVVCCLNVGSAHVGVFGSFENLLAAKSEIFLDAPKGAIGVVNRDQEGLWRFAQQASLARLISFGRHEAADLRLLSQEFHENLGVTKIRIAEKDRVLEAEIPGFHESYGINLAAASAILEALGINPQDAYRNLPAYRPSPGRFRILQGAEGLALIDDSYNANLDSMKAGIKSLQTLYPNAKKSYIIGDMLELGPYAESLHAELGEFLGREAEVSQLICVGDHAEIVLEAFNRTLDGRSRPEVRAFAQVADLLGSDVLNKLVAHGTQGKVVFVKGSRGIGLDQAVCALLPRDLAADNKVRDGKLMEGKR